MLYDKRTQLKTHNHLTKYKHLISRCINVQAHTRPLLGRIKRNLSIFERKKFDQTKTNETEIIKIVPKQ